MAKKNAKSKKKAAGNFAFLGIRTDAPRKREGIIKEFDFDNSRIMMAVKKDGGRKLVPAVVPLDSVMAYKLNEAVSISSIEDLVGQHVTIILRPELTTLTDKGMKVKKGEIELIAGFICASDSHGTLIVADDSADLVYKTEDEDVEMPKRKRGKKASKVVDDDDVEADEDDDSEDEDEDEEEDEKPKRKAKGKKGKKVVEEDEDEDEEESEDEDEESEDEDEDEESEDEEEDEDFEDEEEEDEAPKSKKGKKGKPAAKSKKGKKVVEEDEDEEEDEWDDE